MAKWLNVGAIQPSSHSTIQQKMATRLTPFSKLVITLLIVAGIVLGGRYLLNNTDLGKGIKDKADNSSTSDSGSKPSGDVVNIGVVTWGGYVGGQYFNEGFKANKTSRFYKDYGFMVDFKVLDDFNASREAFRRGDVDLL